MSGPAIPRPRTRNVRRSDRFAGPEECRTGDRLARENSHLLPPTLIPRRVSARCRPKMTASRFGRRRRTHPMTHPLDRVIWHALSTRQAGLSHGNAMALRYDAEYAFFAAT